MAAWFGLCEGDNLKLKISERRKVKVVEVKFVKVKVMKGVIVIVEMANVKGQNNRSKCACHNKESKLKEYLSILNENF